MSPHMAHILRAYAAPVTAAATTATAVQWWSTTSSCDAKTPNVPSKLKTRLTSIGKFSVTSETPGNPSIITFAMTLGGKPLLPSDFCHLWNARDLPHRHDRFHSKIVTSASATTTTTNNDSSSNHNNKNIQQLVPTNQAVDHHVTATTFPLSRADLRQRLEHLQTTRWDLRDHLWHLWIAVKPTAGSLLRWNTTPGADHYLPWAELGLTSMIANFKTSHNNHNKQDPADYETPSNLLLFQAHHVLGDGASLMAAILDVMDEADEIRQEIARMSQKLRRRFWKGGQSWWQRGQRRLQILLAFVWGTMQALSHQAYLYFCAYVWDGRNPWHVLRALSSSNDDETTPRRSISWTVAAPLSQVKWVAAQLSNSDAAATNSKSQSKSKLTVNDIWTACVRGAIVRQLQHHRERLLLVDDTLPPLPTQSHLHMAIPVHLQGGVVPPGQSVGNQLGAMVVRVPGESASSEPPLWAVHRAIQAVKQTPAALLSHYLAKTLSSLSAILPVDSLYQYSTANAVAVVSNNRGLPQPVHLGGRPVQAMYGFVPLPAGIPMGIVILSYADSLNITVTAEPWAVPDADLFLEWTLQEYQQLLQQAQHAAKQKQKQTTEAL